MSTYSIVNLYKFLTKILKLSTSNKNKKIPRRESEGVHEVERGHLLPRRAHLGQPPAVVPRVARQLPSPPQVRPQRARLHPPPGQVGRSRRRGFTRLPQMRGEVHEGWVDKWFFVVNKYFFIWSASFLWDKFVSLVWLFFFSFFICKLHRFVLLKTLRWRLCLKFKSTCPEGWVIKWFLCCKYEAIFFFTLSASFLLSKISSFVWLFFF